MASWIKEGKRKDRCEAGSSGPAGGEGGGLIALGCGQEARNGLYIIQVTISYIIISRNYCRAPSCIRNLLPRWDPRQGLLMVSDPRNSRAQYTVDNTSA